LELNRNNNGPTAGTWGVAWSA